jgi:DNA-binding NarL/FixJ family response regulator
LLCKAIDAFREPAYLVSSQGEVVFANEVARANFPELPTWICEKGRLLSESLCGHATARVCRLAAGSEQLLLVLPEYNKCRDESSCVGSSILRELPPSLAKVARYLIMGLSDKEIAAESHLTLASVRTYTTRIYRRLGVGGRQELLATVLAEQFSSDS